MDTVHSFRSTRARTVYLIPLYSTGSPLRAARTSAHTIARNWLEKGKGLVFDGPGRRKRAPATAHAAAGTLSSLPPLLRSCFMSPIALVMASASRRLRGGLSGLGVPPFSVEHAALVLHDATFLSAGPPWRCPWPLRRRSSALQLLRRSYRSTSSLQFLQRVTYGRPVIGPMIRTTDTFGFRGAAEGPAGLPRHQHG